ncbi:hypothetical protein CHS0354_026261 [Potamilus streckersoni]|uniref:Poly [ADP-ribose] polymerase n=1 Tax=Potamilus streckersoni TaxID=2493646 RepID=A0AAE0T7A1_9BIVA|nr:hypothetical protein CHS0354_026261 [Potamilus streckersoni]
MSDSEDDLIIESSAESEDDESSDVGNVVDDFSAAERKYEKEDIDLGRDLPYTKSFGRVKVQVKIGELEKEKVDVIVNSTSQKLDLTQGALSRILLQKGGETLQQECDIKYPGGIIAGNIAITSAGALDCNHVYHVCLKKWSSGNAAMILESTVRKCLREAHKAGLSTIAFPALGTGFLAFPKDEVVQILLACFKRFSVKYGSSSLTDIRVVLSAEDSKTNKAFAFYRLRNPTRVVFDTTPREISCVTVGNIRVTLVIGRLTKVQCSVVVTTIDSNAKFNQRSLSTSIGVAAGPRVKAECLLKCANGIPDGDVIVCGPGNLARDNVKHIICAAVPRFDKPNSSAQLPATLLCRVITNSLREASKLGMSSIAFPPVGMGHLYFGPIQSSQALYRCIKEFGENNPVCSIKEVKIVIYRWDPNLKSTVQTFEMVAKAHEDMMSSPFPVPAARNTKEFCMMKYMEDTSTPITWTKFTSDKSVKAWRVQQGDKPAYELVTVDKETFSAVENVVKKTWDANKIGQGRDAAGLGAIRYTSLKVTKVQRLENLELYEKYAQCQQTLFHKAGVKGLFEPLEKHLNAKSGEVLTSNGMVSMLQKELYPEINEFFLFHGTKPENVDAIVKQGLDFRIASDNAMFGKGVYFAESSTKADQYTDQRFQRDTKEKRMFLCRVSMGEIGVYNQPRNLKRAPCMESGCESDKCGHENRYDSVVGDGTWIFREFLIYERYQSYPEYLVTYQRC